MHFFAIVSESQPYFVLSKNVLCNFTLSTFKLILIYKHQKEKNNRKMRRIQNFFYKEQTLGHLIIMILRQVFFSRIIYCNAYEKRMSSIEIVERIKGLRLCKCTYTIFKRDYYLYLIFCRRQKLSQDYKLYVYIDGIQKSRK